MCCWRRIRNIYTHCGHGINLPEEEVRCESVRCKFSYYHPSDCVPPICTTTCWQYRQYPQQYSPHLDRLCPICKLRQEAVPP